MGPGFGGTNVHIVMESFENPLSSESSSKAITLDGTSVFTPFTLSGISEKALTASLEAHLAYLHEKRGLLSLRNLAWTLQYKRSQFEYRWSTAARSHTELVQRLSEKLAAIKASQTTGSTNSTNGFIRGKCVRHPHILAVFPGQGAQYAAMGKGIIEASPSAWDIIDALDQALATLPLEDRPLWKLKDELFLDETQSRLHEAEISQPCTTAIQILLVISLKAAGIKLKAVVGHSSGEIGAAFAAGFISAEDAIRNAYYRGLHSGRTSKTGKQGAMLAVSVSAQEATALCNLPKSQGRITLAAINSSSDVTFSGSFDAIEELEAHLRDNGISTKRLSVNNAYHSKYMLRCSKLYETSLEKMDVGPAATNQNRAIWFSSARPGQQMVSVDPQYWSDNMKHPVFFKDAVSAAFKETGAPDLVLEIGPQPVLERAVRRTITEFDDSSPMYTGLLKRGSDAVTSLSGALGLIWSYFGHEAVDMASLDRMLSGLPQPKLVKGLPTYRWQYDKEYWWQSRYMRKQLQSTTPPTELLGPETHMSASHEARWRQFLDPKQSPWVLDHKIDGVAVLPAAAYVSMIVAAVQNKYGDSGIVSIDVTSLRLQQPVIFASEYAKVETILTMHGLKETFQHISGSITIDFCADQANNGLFTAVVGSFCVTLGKDNDRAYPELLNQPIDLVEVKPETFYRHATKKGLDYHGPFRNIISAKRKKDFATGEILLTPSETDIHPAVLDGLLQGANIAGSFPGASALPDIVMPSFIRRITIFPVRCKEIADRENLVHFQAVRIRYRESSGMLHCANIGVAIQFDGMALAPYRLTTAEDDVKMYSGIIWEPVGLSPQQQVDDVHLQAGEPAQRSNGNASPKDSLFSTDDGCDSCLTLSSTSLKSREPLMILGDMRSLSKELEKELSIAFEHVVCVSSLDDIDTETEIPYAILSLVELEEPMFLNMTRDRWQTIQRLFCEATDVLWLTTGIKSPKTVHAVYANMTIGLARCIRHELRHLRLRILDIDDVSSVTAQFLADAMIRWHNLTATGSTNADSAVHPELCYEGGLTYAPVIYRLRIMNERYNSQHRKIFRRVDPLKEAVELVQARPDTYSFQDVPRTTQSLQQDNHMFFEILQCTQFAFKIKGLGFLHLGICRNAERQLCLVALEKNWSLANVRHDWIFPCAISDSPSHMFLERIVASVVAQTVFDQSSDDGSTVLICPNSAWLSCIKSTAEQCSRSIVAITGNRGSKCEAVTYIPKEALDLAISERIPADTLTFINLSDRAEDKKLFERAREALQDRSVLFKDTDAIFRTRAILKSGDSGGTSKALDFLKRVAVGVSQNSSKHAPGANNTTEAQDEVQSDAYHPATAIMNWSQPTVQVPLRTASHAVRFTANRTYLIVGSSDIARSICEWMVKKGAKFLIMTSRNTNTVTAWAHDMRNKGVTLRLHSADITSEASLDHIVNTTKSPNAETEVALPALGGIIDLATVFRDGAFSNISYNAFKAVADVKAKGSLLLHNASAHESLEFFILTSSLSYMIGNPGQANYNAGNAFMASLARYRRSIGLPASVVHLGTVAGIGYMARQEFATQGNLIGDDVRSGVYPISERDLHQIFAEAVLASPVESALDPEIVTGLRDIESSVGHRLPFVQEPMFKNVVKDSSSTPSMPSFEATPQLPLREQLAFAIRSEGSAAGVSEAAFRTVRAALIEKLKALLQVSHIDDAKSVIDLGIDSLAVSEMESWVRTELRIRMQRSVFFGGSVRGVIENVVRRLDMDRVLGS
ncbi:hypothetical protein SLS60_003497 [Paraconiothyrium brasiliense]|uniref:PKS/mFAS DH domain-containing protein n=1 Tax=Paraconiothyrium brasiliense TaxID=300254 RepID=A0ABR3RVW1_9PLEO